MSALAIANATRNRNVRDRNSKDYYNETHYNNKIEFKTKSGSSVYLKNTNVKNIFKNILTFIKKFI